MYEETEEKNACEMADEGILSSEFAKKSLETLGLGLEESLVVPDYDSTIRVFNEGDIVKGKVVKVDKEEVLVDVGYKSEGVIPLRELSIRHDVKPQDSVSCGDEIEALVLQKEDKEGRLVLSRKRATYERAWTEIERIKEEGGYVEGEVIEVVKGGLILDIGLRGFLPASLVDTHRIKDISQFKGQKLEAKIIELDRNRNNVVLSRKAFLETQKSSERREFLESLEKGMRKVGTISSIVNFGVFVDIGGVDGLVHISELSWTHVDHPSEAFSVGDEVEVEILDVDVDKERVSLSIKKAQEDPWERFARENPPGSTVSGKVTKLAPFGAFVEIAPGVEGLAHISELSWNHVEVPEEILSVGDEVEAKIIDINLERRRISLSIKQLTPPVEAEYEEYGERIEVEPQLLDSEEFERKVSEDIKGEVREVTAADIASEISEIATEVEAIESDAGKSMNQEPRSYEEPSATHVTTEEEPPHLFEKREVEEIPITESDTSREPSSLESILEDMKKKKEDQ